MRRRCTAILGLIALLFVVSALFPVSVSAGDEDGETATIEGTISVASDASYVPSDISVFLRTKGDRLPPRCLAELRRAVDSSRISRESARNALIWIWLDMKQYDSAVTACREMQEKYPHGKLFLWPLAQAYYRTENWSDCAAVYDRLRALLADSPGNYFNLIECDFFLHQCYDRLGMPERAREAAEKLMEYESSIPEKTRDRQGSKISTLTSAAR